MRMQYVVTTHHADGTVTDEWFGLDSDAAQEHCREHRPAVKAAGGMISVGIDIRIPDGRTRCPICRGSGSIVTRYGGEGGMFPDEDWCPRCGGSGHVAATETDITPAKVA